MSQKYWTITADKFLSQDQIKALLDHITTQRDLAFARGNRPQAVKSFYMLRVLLESGVRVQEFCDLDESDFVGQRLTVRNGKGGKARTILLTRATAALIIEWLDVKRGLGFAGGPDTPLFSNRYGDRYVTRGVQKEVKRTFRAVGLPETLHTHCLRHSYCSLLLSTGKVGLPTAKANMGHSSIATTNLYAHAIGKIADDVELIEAVGSSFNEKYEPRSPRRTKKANDPVTSFLRSANQKR
jgi:site-specific recombinase XerD